MKVLFLAMNFRRKSTATSDEKKEEIIPINTGKMSMDEEVRKIVNNSTKPDIEIAGIPMRKENLAAVCLSIPENKAEVRVMPDLETPGIIEKACEIPINITSLNLISFSNFLLSP